MKADERAGARVYRRIPKVIRDKKVLEIATGPGFLLTISGRRINIWISLRNTDGDKLTENSFSGTIS